MNSIMSDTEGLTKIITLSIVRVRFKSPYYLPCWPTLKRRYSEKGTYTVDDVGHDDVQYRFLHDMPRLFTVAGPTKTRFQKSCGMNL